MSNEKRNLNEMETEKVSGGKRVDMQSEFFEGLGRTNELKPKTCRICGKKYDSVEYTGALGLIQTGPQADERRWYQSLCKDCAKENPYPVPNKLKF